MSFRNPVKCELLLITNKQIRTYFPYSIQDTLIREVTQAKYLGVTLNNKLTWKKANSVYGFMRCNFNKCSSKIKSALYKSRCDLFRSMLVMFGLHIVIKMYSVYGKSSEESSQICS